MIEAQEQTILQMLDIASLTNEAVATKFAASIISPEDIATSFIILQVVATILPSTFKNYLEVD